jgi:hypothetical protein
LGARRRAQCFRGHQHNVCPACDRRPNQPRCEQREDHELLSAWAGKTKIYSLGKQIRLGCGRFIECPAASGFRSDPARRHR